jgi:hypothetical protein
MQLVTPWPDDHTPRLTQSFGFSGNYRRFGLPGHNGIDVVVPAGIPIRAVADGRVLVTGWDPGGYGEWAKLAHAFGETRYAHFAQGSTRIHAGQDIPWGGLLGECGATGNVTGAHLHFEIRLTSEITSVWKGAVDPTPYLPEPFGQGLALPDDELDELDALKHLVRSERDRKMRWAALYQGGLADISRGRQQYEAALGEAGLRTLGSDTPLGILLGTIRKREAEMADEFARHG